jgi:hypothetical protein
MGYRELSIARPRPTIDIDAMRYDIDYFGMDDGRNQEPDAAFRFIFQLGYELMIHLYVIQAGGASDVAHFAHTFWLKDCAVAHVDMEDLGPPKAVQAAAVALPLVYDSVLLSSAQEERVFAVHAQTFHARLAADGEQELEMIFDLHRGDARAGRLRWSRRRAWEIERQDGSARVLEQGEWVRFAASAARERG